MRISEIVSNASRSTLWVEMALVLFFAVFVGVVFYLWFLIKPEALERAARMPLNDLDPLEPLSLPKNPHADHAHKGEP